MSDHVEDADSQANSADGEQESLLDAADWSGEEKPDRIRDSIRYRTLGEDSQPVRTNFSTGPEFSHIHRSMSCKFVSES